jgi:hypothetical protein
MARGYGGQLLRIVGLWTEKPLSVGFTQGIGRRNGSRTKQIPGGEERPTLAVARKKVPDFARKVNWPPRFVVAH